MINLLTNKQKKIVHRIRIVRIWIAVVVGSMSLTGISLILFLPILLVINQKYTNAKEQEQKMQAVFSVTPESVATLSKRVSETVLLFSGSESASALSYLQIINEKNTNGITLSRIISLSDDKKTIELGGIASTRLSLGRYESSFREDSRVEKVESPVSNYVKTQNTVFQLKIIFK